MNTAIYTNGFEILLLSNQMILEKPDTVEITGNFREFLILNNYELIGYGEF